MSEEPQRADIVRQIEEITKEKGFIYSLAIILLHNFFFDPEEMADIDWHSKLSFQEISFLVGLMVKSTISLELPDENSYQNHISNVDDLFQKLHRSYSQPFMEHMKKISEQGEILEGDREISEKILGSGMAMAEAIFYSDSGAYDFQYLDFAIERYKPDSRWLMDNKGLNIETGVEVCRNLKKMAQDKCINRSKPKDFEEFLRSALSVFCFKIEDLKGFPIEETKSFLETFSLIPGAANLNLSSPGEYNVIDSNPIVKLSDDMYFLPVQFNLARSIYESPFYWMLRDKSYKERSLKSRGQATVNISRKLLAEVFGEANVHEQVIVEKKRGHVITDIDLLAVAGNKAVVIQAKSKKLTLRAREGHDKKLKEDFNDAIQEAYDQGKLSREAILEQKRRLILSNGQEIRLDDTINDVYIICVTSDHYPAAMYQTKTFLEKGHEDPAAITVGIFDLELLTYYLRDPFEFLYYLKQRSLLDDIYFGQSEIDLLAYHLKQKLSAPKDEKSGKPIDGMLVQGMGGLIDAHFPSARGDVPKTKAMEKLHSKWENSDFQEIINQLKASKQSGFTDAIFFLYDLAGGAADRFILAAKDLKAKCLREEKSLRMGVVSRDQKGFSYVCDYRDEGKLTEHLTEYCAVRKYQTKSDMWLGLGGIATSDRLFDRVIFNNTPWEVDTNMEKIAKAIYTNPKSTESKKKIGRNDPCFCGSGIKYKKCHGA